MLKLKLSVPKLPGVTINLRGYLLVVPSLTLGQLEDNCELLTRPIDPATNLLQHVERYLPVIGLAIRENYPELSDDVLRKLISMGQFNELLAIVQGVSGMKEVAPGE